MGTTTKLLLPYPEPTDPVAAGADAIKALAQAIDTTLPGVGYVAQTSTGTSQSVGTGGTNLTGLSVTLTAIAGAKYFVYGIVNFRQRTVGGLVRMAILSSSPIATIGGARFSMGAEEYGTLSAWSLVQTPPAGAVTYYLQGYTSGGTVDFSGLDGCVNHIAVYRV
jgi:hypothetical protein